MQIEFIKYYKTELIKSDQIELSDKLDKLPQHYRIRYILATNFEFKETIIALKANMEYIENMGNLHMDNEI